MTSVLREALSDPQLSAALPVLLMLLLGCWVGGALSFSALFAKFGVAPWKAWVPVYNGMMLFRIAGMSTRWAAALGVGLLIPLINVPVFFLGLAACLIAAQRISVALGRGGVLWSVLFFVNPIVWAAVLGFSSDEPMVDPTANALVGSRA